MQDQLLGEVAGQGVGVKMKTDTAYLQKCIVLIESAATGNIKKQVPLFHPNIEPDVAASAWHRARGVRTWTMPEDVASIDGSRMCGGRCVDGMRACLGRRVGGSRLGREWRIQAENEPTEKKKRKFQCLYLSRN